MKRITLFISLGFIIFLGACSSPEADEVLDYHNDFADAINPKLDKIDQYFMESSQAESDEDAHDIQKNDIEPLVKEIKDYLDDQDPEEDITKEYHDLRSNWADTYYESIQLNNEALEKSIDGSEDEAEELFDEAEEKSVEADDYYEKANDKWDEIMEEYDFEEEES